MEEADGTPVSLHTLMISRQRDIEKCNNTDMEAKKYVAKRAWLLASLTAW